MSSIYEDVEALVVDSLCDFDWIIEDEVKPSSKLSEDFGLHKSDLIQVIGHLEDNLDGLEILPSWADKWVTVKDIVDRVIKIRNNTRAIAYKKGKK